MPFADVFCQEHCEKENLAKNLEVLAKAYEVPVDEIILVDDTPKKRIEEQNYFHVKTYDGTDAEDKEILRVIEYIKSMFPE